jgi:preprotein translocase subunit SecA
MRVFSKIISKIIGSRNDRLLKRFNKRVVRINEFEAKFETLSDDEIKNKTNDFKQRLAGGEKLDDILPEAFAVVREASKRTLGFRHFDCQLLGGMVLHCGNIAEMGTGEGKTLGATLPAYLNALAGRGMHLVTVNDYLAERDAKWMEPIYNFLGLKVGVIYSEQPFEEKQEAYKADITYGTNNEFGFDYLRDNMVFSSEEKVQRDLHYAVVDEVDSILIDEARTPLIISGEAEDSSELYQKIDKLVPDLTRQKDKDSPGHFYIDEKEKQAYLSEDGHAEIESLLMSAGVLGEGESLYHAKNIILMHHISAALRANAIYQKDVDYIVKNGEVVIVDEHTGRTMEGRRWSDGLHQAVEAKEHVKIQHENQTLASTTFQNYFRLYNKLSGMTGTADTEAYEFHQIYGLEVVVVPPNKPLIRKDNKDVIYFNQEDKFRAIVEDIEVCRANHQPMLVGTASIETSEILSNSLKQKNIPHEVLNAKFHEREATIIAEAGRPGAVTIATNMAGRGTDIVLGGNVEVEIAALQNPTDEEISSLKADWQKRHDQVISAGGLYVMGTERHESRRIDNQLRGRSGRQGDPGKSRFYLSIDDNLLRIFAADRLSGLLKRLGMDKGSSLESGLLTRSIESAQRKVESFNFDMRKQLLEYDDIANDQRQVVYHQRSQLMALEDVSEVIQDLCSEVANTLFKRYIPLQSLEEQWDVDGLQHELKESFGLDLPIQTWLKQEEALDEIQLLERVDQGIANTLREKENQITPDIMRQVEKSVLLQSLDMHWKEHLSSMDHLRQGIHLRSYAQKNPKQEYKRESFELFKEMLSRIKIHVIALLTQLDLQEEEDVEALENHRRQSTVVNMTYQHDESSSALASPDGGDEVKSETTPFVRTVPKVGRNDACPCGSGKKYKKCHGELSQVTSL